MRHRIRRLKVTSHRNSESSAKLSQLDWSRWFTDGHHRGALYLHVYHQDEESIHRVYCKHGSARLAFEGGELFWLVP